MFSESQSTHDYMSVVLTHECNRRCSFCVDKYRGSGESISKENVERAIDFAREHKIKDVLLVGGEPTLHPDVRDIAIHFKSCGFRVIMTTNYTKPDVVKSLDGIVECFNISFYEQPVLPKQSDFKSDLTLHALIHSRQLFTVDLLNAFIDEHQYNGHLKFSTLTPCNEWAAKHQIGDFLNGLDCKWLVLFNEILGQKYRGAIIKRYDRVINKCSHQSYKWHVDGKVSQSWDRT
jgi:hypothetical protein